MEEAFLRCYSEWYIHKNKFVEIRVTKLYVGYIDYCGEVLLNKEQFCEKIFNILKIPNYQVNKS